jgi:hypothetical protein
MYRRLDDGDVRATRAYLADDVFLSVPGGKDPPKDPVSRKTWRGVMSLPTDVLLRTTDYLGTMVSDMHEQWGAWIASFPPDPSAVPYMFEPALDAADEFDAAPFIAMHGYYRQATAGLRNALETMITGAALAISKNQKNYREWRESAYQPKFGNQVDLLASDPTLAARDQTFGGPTLFGPRTHGVLRRLYANLNRYAHGWPNSTNGAIWQSNGPVFIGRAFTQFWIDYGDTLAACYVLFKIGWPGLELPKVARSVFDATSADWLGIGKKARKTYFP